MENFENLKVGDIVTVITGKKYNIATGSSFLAVGIDVKEQEDGSYKGDVLEIKALQFPYAILKNRSEETIFGKNHRITLDLREWKLMKLNPDFIKEGLLKNSNQ